MRLRRQRCTRRIWCERRSWRVRGHCLVWDGRKDGGPYDTPQPPSQADEFGHAIFQNETNSTATPQKGGDGGDGGDAGRGGYGGKGGSAASAILNAVSGTVKLVDTTFGGRLSSGLMDEGNSAKGGLGGRAAPGGNGGFGSAGGDGGDFGVEWSRLEQFFFADLGYGDYRTGLIHFATSPGGVGGNAGDDGNGGDGGNGGAGGDAATILNFGSLSGFAAFTDSTMTGGAGGLAGAGSLGGRTVELEFNGKGGAQSTDWAEWEIARSFSTGVLGGPSDSPKWEAYLAPFLAAVAVGPTALADAADGLAGRVGLAGAAGDAGGTGKAVDTILNKGGTNQTDRAAGLVYLHSLGQGFDADGSPILSFNVIRVGDVFKALTLHWRLVPDGRDAQVSATDFDGGVLPS